MATRVRIRPSKYAKMTVQKLRVKCVKGDKQACHEVYWRSMGRAGLYPESLYKSHPRGGIRGIGGAQLHRKHRR